MRLKLADVVETANTGADAIKKAPIVERNTGLRCLRIGDVSQKRKYSEWGFTETTEQDFERFRLEVDDIIVARTGNTIGVNCIIDEEINSVYNNGLIRIKVNTDKVLPRFLYYVISSTGCQNYIQSIAFGTSTQPNMKIKDFLRYEFEYIEIPEQKKVVSLIHPIERKRIINEKIIDKIIEEAIALYKSWFITFERFDGIMPNTWREGTIEDIVELHDSKRKPLSGQERSNMRKIYPYYGATSQMDMVDDYLFDGIYLLLGEDGSVMDSAGFPILQYVSGKFWVNNHAHIMSGKNGFSVEQLYLLFSLTNVKGIVTGAVQQKISQGNLKKIHLIIPDRDILERFNEIIQPMFKRIRKLRSENERLDCIKDALLSEILERKISFDEIAI